jgi:hypothetical protein
MSASLHANETHRRRHRKQKRDKLRARLAKAPAGARAAIEAKILRTYPLGSEPRPPKAKAPDAAPIPATLT